MPIDLASQRYKDGQAKTPAPSKLEGRASGPSSSSYLFGAAQSFEVKLRGSFVIS
jgi:hypothetical protein